MARKPTDAVQFTLESAERIADVVRAAELATPQGRPLTFDAAPAAAKVRAIRIATFSGAWAMNSSKVVTFKGQISTPNTASVTNPFWPLPNGPQRDCAIFKDRGAWYLLVPAMYSANAATTAELTTAAIVFRTVPVAALASAAAATFTLSVTTCSTASS